MQIVKVNGVHIHYADSGNRHKQPFVFSNSLGTDFRVWNKLLALLGDDCRFILYDKRGHGLSQCTAPPHTLDDHVADLAELLKVLGVSKAYVCGLSVGGLIAQGLSASHPELIKALILCDTAHVIGPPEIWDERLEIIKTQGISALATPILERWFSNEFRTQHPQELAGWREMLVRTPLDGYLGTAMAIRNGDMTEAAKAIRVPTLCLGGSEDGATPPDLVQSMAALIPGAQFQIVDGAGHLPCVEQPQQMAGYMIKFIEEVERG